MEKLRSDRVLHAAKFALDEILPDAFATHCIALNFQLRLQISNRGVGTHLGRVIGLSRDECPPAG
jgi:hypothetical protein